MVGWSCVAVVLITDAEPAKRRNNINVHARRKLFLNNRKLCLTGEPSCMFYRLGKSSEQCTTKQRTFDRMIFWFHYMCLPLAGGQ